MTSAERLTIVIDDGRREILVEPGDALSTNAIRQSGEEIEVHIYGERIQLPKFYTIVANARWWRNIGFDNLPYEVSRIQGFIHRRYGSVPTWAVMLAAGLDLISTHRVGQSAWPKDGRPRAILQYVVQNCPNAALAIYHQNPRSRRLLLSFAEETFAACGADHE